MTKKEGQDDIKEAQDDKELERSEEKKNVMLSVSETSAQTIVLLFRRSFASLRMKKNFLIFGCFVC